MVFTSHKQIKAAKAKLIQEQRARAKERKLVQAGIDKKKHAVAPVKEVFVRKYSSKLEMPLSEQISNTRGFIEDVAAKRLSVNKAVKKWQIPASPYPMNALVKIGAFKRIGEAKVHRKFERVVEFDEDVVELCRQELFDKISNKKPEQQALQIVAPDPVATTPMRRIADTATQFAKLAQRLLADCEEQLQEMRVININAAEAFADQHKAQIEVEVALRKQIAALEVEVGMGTQQIVKLEAELEKWQPMINAAKQVKQ